MPRTAGTATITTSTSERTLRPRVICPSRGPARRAITIPPTTMPTLSASNSTRTSPSIGSTMSPTIPNSITGKTIADVMIAA